MKKIITVLLVAILCLGAVFALTACNPDGDLQFGVVYSYYPIEENNTRLDYYKFNKDGTGKYCRYDSTVNYTIYFIYTFTDKDKSAIVCYYDSIEDNSLTTSFTPDNTWTAVLLVSKNTVIRTTSYGYDIYTNKNYYDEIPNYRK